MVFDGGSQGLEEEFDVFLEYFCSTNVVACGFVFFFWWFEFAHLGLLCLDEVGEYTVLFHNGIV